MLILTCSGHCWSPRLMNYCIRLNQLGDYFTALRDSQAVVVVSSLPQSQSSVEVVMGTVGKQCHQHCDASFSLEHYDFIFSAAQASPPSGIHSKHAFKNATATISYALSSSTWSHSSHPTYALHEVANCSWFLMTFEVNNAIPLLLANPLTSTFAFKNKQSSHCQSSLS